MITRPWLRHIIIDIFGGNEATLSAEINEQKLHVENVTFFIAERKHFMGETNSNINKKKGADEEKIPSA